MRSNEAFMMNNMTSSRKERLLNFMGLDKQYVNGYNDWLEYIDKSGECIKVLDLTGSYGINLHGHKNKELTKELIDAIQNGPPAFVQASSSIFRPKLETLVSKHLEAETRCNDWMFEYANTGAEIIETALKLAFLRYRMKLEKIRQEIILSLNKVSKCNQHLELTEILNASLALIDQRPIVIHLQNSFHGKTLGALSAMGNQGYKNDFPTAFDSFPISTHCDHLEDSFNSIVLDYFVADATGNKLVKKSFAPVVGMVLEPIQGEAGIFIHQQKFIDRLFVLLKKYEISIISDEIQAGLYRTGTFTSLKHYGFTADIYCFGKALGGGVTKMSMLAANSNKFDQNFFRLHSTSFGEDAFSMRVACSSINLAQQYSDLAAPVLNKLKILKEEFPHFVKDVRGIGQMWAIEFDHDQINTSYLRKYLKDIDLLGYWISSVLLEREQLRLLPTLSAPLTFRIQPSLLFSEYDMVFLLNGIRNFIREHEKRNTEYLFGHLLPSGEQHTEKELPISLKNESFPENAAVFLCHPVDAKHYKQIVDLVDGYSELEIESLVNEMSELQKFTPYHVCKIYNAQGAGVDVVFLGIPFISDEFYRSLKSGKRTEMIRQIQDAVDLANSRNAKVIGLGQFTSVITENGLRLHSTKARITTGNAYTAQSTIESLFYAAKMRSLDLKMAKVGVVGAAGNIVSVITEALIPHVGQLSLVFNGSIFESKKNRATVIRVLSAIRNASIDKDNFEHLSDEELLATLEEESVFRFLTVHKDLNDLKTCDVVICGANATEPLIKKEHIKSGAIIIDIAVPANVSQDVIDDIAFTYFKGGIIELPKRNGSPQELNSVIFPFEKGESFACMAETIGLSFDEDIQFDYTGDISLEKLTEISSVLSRNGFKLKGLKLRDSL